MEKPELPEIELIESDEASRDDNEVDWTVEEETRVRRKIDWALIPLMTGLYLLCFLDRNARIQGLGRDLKLEGYQFNWALTIFYIVYAVVEVPSNILIKKVGPRWWIPFLVVGFGLISICTAFIKNFSQLMAMRFLLGLFEGGTMPGIAFYLTCFYRRQELLFRIGIFISAASMAGAFGGLLATGLTRIPAWGIAGARIATWRNIFFFEGLVTILAGISAPWFMARDPESASFLTQRERYIAAKRLYIEHKANPAEQVEWRHIKRAILNVNTNVCAFGFFVISITVQSLSLFMPTLLSDLGWTATKAQLYTVPPYVLACLISIAIAFVSDRTRRRGLWLALFAPLGIIGFAVLRSNVAANIRYMAVFFVTTAAFPGGPAMLAWALNNAAGPATRAVAGGYVVSVGTMGAIVATWTYLPSDAPYYPIGHSINLTAQCLALLLSLFGISYILWENKQREMGKRDHRLQGKSEQEMNDLGHRHPSFRYIP